MTMISALALAAHTMSAPIASVQPDAVEADATPQPAIGEVTVTARRRQETAQDVPLAISVVSAHSVTATGNFNILQLLQLVPTLQVYSSNPRNTAVNIRGLGAPFGLTSDGFEQGVGIYVDDVYNARVAAATFDFLDVKQVEVLRGPQGTLYGKNTTAGAINITTNQPTFNFEARAELTAGNLDYRQFKGAISGPLSDTVAARFAISRTNRRGTLYNVTSNRDINAQDNTGIRGQLLFKPSDDISLTLSGDYSAQNPECCGTVFVRTGLTQRALNRQYETLSAAQGYVVVSRNPYDRLSDVDASLNAGNKIGGVSLRTKWDVGPGTLTSISAWRFWDWKPENDRDFTGLSIVSKSQNPSQQDQYSQELRYNYAGKRLDFVLGAFGFRQRIDLQGTEQQGANASKWILAPSTSPTNVANIPATLAGLTANNTQSLRSASVALFGEVSWKVTSALTLQPGARINSDKKSGFYQRIVTTGSGKVIASCAPAATAGNAVLTAQCGIYQPQISAPSDSEWNFSYDLNVNYKFARDVLAYATYAKSFKTLGINQNGLPLDQFNQPIASAGTVKPESVNHYELGLKTQFWDRRATVNLTAFRTDIRNFQATVQNGQLGVLRGYLANAGRVCTQGIELDSSFRPSGYFSGYLNGAYTDAKYKRFVDAPCPPELAGGTTATATQIPGTAGVPGSLSPANCDISGQRLPGVSKWSVSYGGELHVPLTLSARAGQAYFGVDGSYRSNFSSNPSPSAYTFIDGYAVTNFRLGFRTERGIDVFGWVRNAFDTHYLELLQVAPSNVGLIAGTPGDPRTYGVTLSSPF